MSAESDGAERQTVVAAQGKQAADVGQTTPRQANRRLWNRPYAEPYLQQRLVPCIRCILARDMAGRDLVLQDPHQQCHLAEALQHPGEATARVPEFGAGCKLRHTLEVCVQTTKAAGCNSADEVLKTVNSFPPPREKCANHDQNRGEEEVSIHYGCVL